MYAKDLQRTTYEKPNDYDRYIEPETRVEETSRVYLSSVGKANNSQRVSNVFS
jgi:hypothetical protein